MQFQSCDGSSYCTALGENGCTDIVSCQLRDSSMFRQWCRQFTKAKPMCMMKTVVANPSLVMPKLIGKCMASSFAEPTLHNFRTLWWIPSDVLLTAAQNRLPVAGNVSRMMEREGLQMAVTSWLPRLVVDSYDTGIQMFCTSTMNASIMEVTVCEK